MYICVCVFMHATHMCETLLMVQHASTHFMMTDQTFAQSTSTWCTTCMEHHDYALCDCACMVDCLHAA